LIALDLGIDDVVDELGNGLRVVSHEAAVEADLAVVGDHVGSVSKVSYRFFLFESFTSSITIRSGVVHRPLTSRSLG